MENSNKPAFPNVNSDGYATDFDLITNEAGAIGLTKEEYYAGFALQGILSKTYGSPFSTSDFVAENSLKYAKALCKLLEKQELEKEQSAPTDYVEL
ncbi:hypothetical protein CMU39_09190 [Elizabethkingia anophelis]|nr:hypothetical protein [Elizabethkingia anophelis]